MIILAIAVPHAQTVKKLKFSSWDTIGSIETHVSSYCVDALVVIFYFVFFGC
jgi:hypothetical protein